MNNVTVVDRRSRTDNALSQYIMGRLLSIINDELRELSKIYIESRAYDDGVVILDDDGYMITSMWMNENSVLINYRYRNRTDTLRSEISLADPNFEEEARVIIKHIVEACI